MKKIIVFISILSISLFCFFEAAQALRITLKRVVFEGPKRAEVVTIINSKDVPVTYRLGWRNFKMTEEKSLVEIPKGQPIPSEIKPAEDMVRFAPRRFTIPPQSSQQVRMMLRLPSNLEDGEYRSHLWVRPEADVEDLRKRAEEKNKEEGKEGGVRMTMLAGVTMPVFVRKGNLSASAEIKNLNVTQTPGFVDVSFYLARTGNKSIYGDMDYICNNGGSGEYIIRNSKGNAVYTEVAGRKFNLRIEKQQDKPECKTLTVRYIETDKFMGAGSDVLAEATSAVN